MIQMERVSALKDDTDGEGVGLRKQMGKGSALRDDTDGEVVGTQG